MRGIVGMFESSISSTAGETAEDAGDGEAPGEFGESSMIGSSDVDSSMSGVAIPERA